MNKYLFFDGDSNDFKSFAVETIWRFHDFPQLTSDFIIELLNRRTFPIKNQTNPIQWNLNWNSFNRIVSNRISQVTQLIWSFSSIIIIIIILVYFVFILSVGCLVNSSAKCINLCMLSATRPQFSSWWLYVWSDILRLYFPLRVNKFWHRLGFGWVFERLQILNFE